MCSKLDPKYKSPVNGIEKYYLRMAFKDGYLPESVLFRRKDGFSDGVSSHDKSWYEYIQEYIDKYDMIENGTEMLTLKTKESKFYKNIYDEHYKKYSPIIPTWMPKWSDSDDPSSRRITFTSK
jgi:asparagine synthase (glutamine-hydrolysing)